MPTLKDWRSMLPMPLPANVVVLVASGRHKASRLSGIQGRMGPTDSPCSQSIPPTYCMHVPHQIMIYCSLLHCCHPSILLTQFFSEPCMLANCLFSLEAVIIKGGSRYNRHTPHILREFSQVFCSYFTGSHIGWHICETKV